MPTGNVWVAHKVSLAPALATGSGLMVMVMVSRLTHKLVSLVTVKTYCVIVCTFPVSNPTTNGLAMLGLEIVPPVQEYVNPAIAVTPTKAVSLAQIIWLAPALATGNGFTKTVTVSLSVQAVPAPVTCSSYCVILWVEVALVVTTKGWAAVALNNTSAPGIGRPFQAYVKPDTKGTPSVIVSPAQAIWLGPALAVTDGLIVITTVSLFIQPLPLVTVRYKVSLV